MKSFLVHMLLFANICLLPAEDSLKESELRALVVELGAEGFPEREAAEARLKEMGRDHYDLLKELSLREEDPEIQLRLEEVLLFHQRQSRGAATSFAVLIPEEKRVGNLRQELKAFALASQVQVENLHHDAISAGPFAQRVILNQAGLRAVELGTSPRQGQSGWMRLDIHQEEEGRPGLLLARSWVRIPKQHGMERGMTVLHDIPDLELEPGSAIWLVYIDFADEGGNTRLSEYHFSMKTDPLPNMPLWRHGVRDPSPKAMDIQFRLFSKSTELPLSYRTATEREEAEVRDLEPSADIIRRAPWMQPPR